VLERGRDEKNLGGFGGETRMRERGLGRRVIICRVCKKCSGRAWANWTASGCGEWRQLADFVMEL
jgi:hypothetical protein